MTEQEANKEPDTRHLPSLLPSASLLVLRTQTTLKLLQEVKQQATADYWFERGRAAEGSTQWAEAAYAYRQCLERNAEHWRGAVRLTAALGQLGQTEAAAVALTEGSEAAVDGWNVLVAEVDETTWNLLQERLEAARGTAGNGFRLLWGLALVYRAVKNNEKARRTLEVMRFMYERQVVGSPQLFRLSGSLYLDAGLHAEAIADFDRAIELKSDYAFAYHNRAISEFSLHDYARAILDFDRAIVLQPNILLSYLHRGIAKSNIKDYAGAISDYAYAIALKPDFFLAYYNRASAKKKLKDYTGAIADYNYAIELEPYDAYAYHNRGVAKANSQNYAGAILDYNRAVELNVDEAFFYHNRALAKAELQEHAKAIADYNRVIELEPDNADAYNDRGVSKGELEDHAGAIFDYNRAIELKPDAALFYLNRAFDKEKLGDAVGAAEDIDMSANLSP